MFGVWSQQEEFFDIPITVQGSDGLKTSLINSFQMREGLNGNNQYKCEKCNNQYRDAEKYCQLKTLPPILTLSLLRFTYDLRTYQRIKETSRFEFPLEIDLNEFMEVGSTLQVFPLTTGHLVNLTHLMATCRTRTSSTWSLSTASTSCTA